MKIKNFLGIFLAGSLILTSGCTQSVVTYHKVEEKYFNNIKAAADSIIAEKERALSTPLQASVDLSLSEELGKDFSDISLHIDSAAKNDNAYGVLTLGNGDYEVNAEYWIDETASKAYALLPDMSDIYILFDCSEFLPEKDFNNISADILSVFEKTSEVYFELAGEPEILKDQELKVNDIVYTADKLSVHLDSVSLAKIAKSFTNSLLENENIVDLLCLMTECESKEELVSDEGYSEFIKHLDDIINGTETEDVAFDMNVYLKGDDIIGREITLSNPELEIVGIKLNIYELQNEGGEIVTYLDFKVDDEDLAVTLMDEKNGNTHNGAFSAVNYGEGYSVSYNDLAISNDLFQGTVKLASLGDSQILAAVELKTEEKSKLIEISMPDVCDIKIAVKPSELKIKELPNPSAGEYVDLISELNNLENPSEAMERLTNDIMEYITRTFIPKGEILEEQAHDRTGIICN